MWKDKKCLNKDIKIIVTVEDISILEKLKEVGRCY